MQSGETPGIAGISDEIATLDFGARMSQLKVSLRWEYQVANPLCWILT